MLSRSPESNGVVILATTPDDGIKTLLGNYRASVMAGGHTHIQMLRHFQQSLLVNPGSVGMPFERDSHDKQYRPPHSEYAIVEAEGDRLAIELRRTSLDVDAVIASARRSGMPGAEEWSASWIANG